jgi:hypothetical protein
MGLFGHRRTSLRTNFTVVSVMMVVVGVVLAFMSLRSINYKQTEGKIIQSDITGTGKNRHRTIRYLYTVDGVNYDNDTVSYAVNLFRDGELLAKYPMGRSVTVYYSITDPSYSVLEKGFSFGAVLLMTAGLGLFVVVRRSRE